MSYLTRRRDRIDHGAQPRFLRRMALAIVITLVTALLIAGSAPASAQQGTSVCAKYQQELTRSARNVFGPGAPIADLAGQTQQESSCNHLAKSRVGAGGLSQFMPATAADMAARYPAECAPANPFDPAWAFRCRDRYMKSLLDATKTMTAKPLTECQLWWLGFKDYNGGGGWTRKQRKAALAVLADPNDPVTLQMFPAGRSLSNHVENGEYAPRIFRRARSYEAAGWGRRLNCP